MEERLLVQLLGYNRERTSKMILEYHKEVQESLESAGMVSRVEYLDEIIKTYKWILDKASEQDIDLADADWGKALLDIFEMTAVIFKGAHKYRDSLEMLLLVYLANPSGASSRKYDLAEMSLEYGRHDILENYFSEDRDLEILMANILSAIKRVEELEARFYFERLRKKYPDVALFFEKELLLSNDIEMELPETLKRNDEFSDMLDRYHDYFTEAYYLLSLGDFAKNPLDEAGLKAELEELQEKEYYAIEMEEFLKEIGVNRSGYGWNLVRAGIMTKDDFKKYTKQEVLRIDGIGPKTIIKLEEAGVEFKEV